MGCNNSKVADPAAGKGGPVLIAAKDRKCRDVLWVLLFTAYMVGMGAVAVLGLKNGDPARLLYALDAAGKQCGGKDSVCYDGKPCGQYAVFPRVDKDFAQAFAGGGFNVADPTAWIKIPFFSVCTSGCPEGTEDVDGDGQIRDWVCDYDTSKALNLAHPAAAGETWTSKEIPSRAGKAALEACLSAKQALGGVFAELLMDATCKTLLSGCYKSYVPEKAFLFRCLPQKVDNSTCSYSPYLAQRGYDVKTKRTSSGAVVARPASDPLCGVCLDPVFDESGLNYTAPSSKECRAKRVQSESSSLSATPNPLFDQVSSWNSLLSRWMGDVGGTYEWILISGAAGSIGLGMVWLLLLRFFAGIFVWAVLYGMLLVLIALSVELLMWGGVITVSGLTNVFSSLSGNSTASAQAAALIVSNIDVADSQSAQSSDLYMYAGFVFCALTLVYLLMLLTLRKKVRLAVQVLKEATKVVAVMPSILAFPLFTVLLSIAVCGYWAYVSMLISSSGTIDVSKLPGVDLGEVLNLTGNATGGRLLNDVAGDGLGALKASAVSQLVAADSNTYLWLYNFFGFLWVNQLIQAVSATTIAGAVASHYWASDKQEEKASKMPAAPVLASLRRVLRFHLGSLIFGSFIIAVVQLVRAGLAYLDHQTAALQKKNVVVRVLMKVVQCCLWCFEKVLKFVTKHAYIQIALKGTSFCAATKDGFMLLVANLALIGVASSINNIILLFARLVIVVGASAMCFVTVGIFYKDDAAPSSIAVPVAVAAVLSWFVSGLFLAVYALAVDTILVCFCEDIKHNDGSASKPYYMSKALQRISNKSNKMFKQEQAIEKTAGKDEDEEPDSPDSPAHAPAANVKGIASKPSQDKVML
jgi:choline transporter-like protein 2/4/5